MAKYRNVQGVEVIQRQFDRMSKAAAERLADALNTSAKEIEARARLLAPVGRGRKSAASMKYGPLKSQIEVLSPFEAVRKSRGRSRGVIASGVSTGRAFYARFVEFGTTRGATPRPFFWPAYRSVRKKVRSRITRAINAAAREAVRNG